VQRSRRADLSLHVAEIIRVFDHRSARYILRVLTDGGRSDPDTGYLKTSTADWLPVHFNPASYEAKRRKYLTSPTK